MNERVVAIQQELGPDPRGDVVAGLICECSDPECLERVGPLTIREYEAVRADRRRFIIARNHESPEVERVVAKNANYWVVEKRACAVRDLARVRDSWR